MRQEPRLGPLPNEVSRMSEKQANRDLARMADAYWRDGQDYLRRFELVFNSEHQDHSSIKSRRVKAYIDLRMAVETTLKSLYCLDSKKSPNSTRNILKYEFKHNIAELAKAVGLDINSKEFAALKKCERAPVHWRYEVEARQSRSNDERDYYDTVGEDSWIAILIDFVTRMLRQIDGRLKTFSRVVSAAEVADEMFSSM
jgi:hypothetical protein